MREQQYLVVLSVGELLVFVLVVHGGHYILVLLGAVSQGSVRFLFGTGTTVLLSSGRVHINNEGLFVYVFRPF